MLEKDPLKRITVAEILEHPSVTNCTDYFRQSLTELGSPMSPKTPLKKVNTFFDMMQGYSFQDMFSKVTSKNVVEISLKQKDNEV